MSRSHSQLLTENNALRRELAGYRAILLTLEKNWFTRWIVMRAVRRVSDRVREVRA